ncbi:MAG: RluA family pseudouridine synthase [Elusimicrobia bacterium]|nr:RluA family pseudouridine synthase [Elusimicrobiota bacterium]
MSEALRKISVEETEGERIDTYLSRRIPLTRSRVKKLIEGGHVRLNGKVTNCHHAVSPGDEIIFEVPEKKAAEAKGIYPPPDIICECESYVIINKAPGVVVHPAAGYRGSTLLDSLASRYPGAQLVHRLDKDTSGVMVAALTAEAGNDLRRQFKDREVKKVYLALVEGVIKEDSGEISAPIRRSSKDPTMMRVGWSGSRPSATRFTVKERFGNGTFVEVYPLSGRTHQIRVHMSYTGYPIIGDTKYSGGMMAAPRQMLHAWQISFSDPGTGRRVHYEAPVPEDFSSILSSLKNS